MSHALDRVTLPSPEIHWPPAPRSKWEQEYQAFCRLLPQLLKSNRGDFVAIHEERMIDSDAEEMVLITRVLKRIGNVDFHVGFVTDQPERVYRSGVVRELRQEPLAHPTSPSLSAPRIP